VGTADQEAGRRREGVADAPGAHVSRSVPCLGAPQWIPRWGAARAGPPCPARRRQNERHGDPVFAEILQPRLNSGHYLDVRFEPFKLRLADATFYTFDFVAVRPDCFELHEVKGHWEDDARVKWKTAAETFWWFKFFAAMYVKGAWKIEEYRACK